DLAAGPAGGLEARQDGRARLLARQRDRVEAQTGGVGRGRAGTAAVPRVQAEVVVVAAGRDEEGRLAAGDDVEAEDPMVERLRLGDVADLQVGVADRRASRHAGPGATRALG